MYHGSSRFLKVMKASAFDKSLALGLLCAVGGVNRHSLFDLLSNLEKQASNNFKMCMVRALQHAQSSHPVLCLLVVAASG